jgi:hypothetical protein
MHPTTRKLLAAWRRKGIRPAPPCSRSDLQAFETRTGLTLPEDLADYLAYADGASLLSAGDVDRDELAFRPLRRFASLDAEWAGRQGPHRIADASRYFVFCGYRLPSWAFAIRLHRPGEGGDNLVISAAMTTAFVVAVSFSEFVELYEADAVVAFPL